MSLLFLIVGVGAYVLTTQAGVKSVITYDIKYNSDVIGQKIKVNNKNWNYSEETSYFDAQSLVTTVHTGICIVNDGYYKVNHASGKLRYQSKCEPTYITQAQAESSPDYVNTTTFLGYTVVVTTNDYITVYYSPALQDVLKYDLGNGKVIEATSVTTSGVPTVVLPAYSVESYNEYKEILLMQLQESIITQAEYDQLYNEIPAQFR